MQLPMNRWEKYSREKPNYCEEMSVFVFVLAAIDSIFSSSFADISWNQRKVNTSDIIHNGKGE